MKTIDCCENMLDEFGQPSLYCCHENGLGDEKNVEIKDKDDCVWMSSCCGGSAMTELVEDGDIGVAICSECRDWSDFELEEE